MSRGREGDEGGPSLAGVSLSRAGWRLERARLTACLADAGGVQGECGAPRACEWAWWHAQQARPGEARTDGSKQQPGLGAAQRVRRAGGRRGVSGLHEAAHTDVWTYAS